MEFQEIFIEDATISGTDLGGGVKRKIMVTIKELCWQKWLLKKTQSAHCIIILTYKFHLLKVAHLRSKLTKRKRHYQKGIYFSLHQTQSTVWIAKNPEF